MSDEITYPAIGTTTRTALRATVAWLRDLRLAKSRGIAPQVLVARFGELRELSAKEFCPEYVVDRAVNRRGRLEPLLNHRGLHSRMATADGQGALRRISRAVNTPRLRIRVRELGTLHQYLVQHIETRFCEDE